MANSFWQTVEKQGPKKRVSDESLRRKRIYRTKREAMAVRDQLEDDTGRMYDIQPFYFGGNGVKPTHWGVVRY